MQWHFYSIQQQRDVCIAEEELYQILAVATGFLSSYWLKKINEAIINSIKILTIPSIIKHPL